MLKIIFVFTLLIFSYGCSSQTSFLGSGITIASGGSISQTSLTAGANFFLKEATGKNSIQHIADKTIYAELRKCEINHSAEINKIFFDTLDQIDCDNEYSVNSIYNNQGSL
tara:strand:+ start:83 stop:415 length:333 start_codon:yes stop_codon:yes gene_type:complete